MFGINPIYNVFSIARAMFFHLFKLVFAFFFFLTQAHIGEYFIYVFPSLAERYCVDFPCRLEARMMPRAKNAILTIIAIALSPSGAHRPRLRARAHLHRIVIFHLKPCARIRIIPAFQGNHY